MDILDYFRQQIDTIDEEIIYLLSRRFEIVKQIGTIKKEQNMPILQKDRWEKVMNNLMKEADDKGVNKEFVKAVWQEIHKESLRIEK